MKGADEFANSRYQLACPRCSEVVIGQDVTDATRLIVNHAIAAHGRAPGGFVPPSSPHVVAWHKCPRCNGVGTTWRPPWIPGDQEVWVSSSTPVYDCSMCKGKGLVVL